MRRSIPIAPGEHYHIFNRGNNKQNIFKDDRDRIRFLFLLLYFQSPILFTNISRPTNNYVKHRVFNILEDQTKKVVKNRFVELVNFALMPNHFHLTVYELKEGGIAQYMQRTLNAYTKYFNTRHQQSGHLFQGPYKAIHIRNERQLLYLSAYIHRNPRELQNWKNKEHRYPWSSLQDYCKENRWGRLLAYKFIIEQFSNKKDYRKFVEKSGAKELDRELSDLEVG